MKPTILYVMDPLCGWCYGFSPVMQQFKAEYQDRFTFRVIPGGMITGARVQPMAEMAGYILESYKRVEEYSGVVFGEPYLELLREGTEIHNSEPPCRALYTFQKGNPGLGVDFAHQLQLKLFLAGKSFNDEHTYRELASAFNINGQAFVTDMNSEESRYGVQQEFQWVQAAGISGFPCVVLEKEEKYYMISRGYQSYEGITEVMTRVLEDI